MFVGEHLDAGSEAAPLLDVVERETFGDRADQQFPSVAVGELLALRGTKEAVARASDGAGPLPVAGGLGDLGPEPGEVVTVDLADGQRVTVAAPAVVVLGTEAVLAGPLITARGLAGRG